jgi:hypothetical protein
MNCKTFSVVNWEKYQHYKDRTPPWIKLHAAILNNYEFSCLQDASKAHLILIWVLASQMDNCIPADPLWLGKKIGSSSSVNLLELQECGFIEIKGDASVELAGCLQSACIETETETETETEKTQYELAPPARTALVPKPVKPDLTPEFEQLWTALPRESRTNVSKKHALKCYEKARANASFHDILTGAQAMAAQWANKPVGAFVPRPPMASTWLNQERWAADYSPTWLDAKDQKSPEELAELKKMGNYWQDFLDEAPARAARRKKAQEDREAAEAWIAEHPEFLTLDPRPPEPVQTSMRIFVDEC